MSNAGPRTSALEAVASMLIRDAEDDWHKHQPRRAGVKDLGGGYELHVYYGSRTGKLRYDLGYGPTWAPGLYTSDRAAMVKTVTSILRGEGPAPKMPLPIDEVWKRLGQKDVDSDASLRRQERRNKEMDGPA